MQKQIDDSTLERAVLGALLADNSLLSDVAEILSADDFGAEGHKLVFGAMLALDVKGSKVDQLTVAEELSIQGVLSKAGGASAITSLDVGVPLAFNALEYARIVRDRAVRRGLAGAARDILDSAAKSEGEIEGLLDDAERRIFEIAEKKRTGDLIPLSELMEPALDMLDKMRKSGGGVTGTPTGFIDLDDLLTGFHGGELLILAARPGVGKTSFAMNIGLHVARLGRAVGVFSLEMPSVQLVTRLLATAARVNMKNLRGGKLTALDEERIQEEAAPMFGLKLFIDDSGGLSTFDLRAKARRLKQRHPDLSLLIIDYLQLMHQKGKVESRQLEVSEISRGLKQLAKELNVPILALSQLNRKVEERKGGKPMLSDLRESGAIEQDADVVMFIHREDDGGGEGAPPPTKTAVPVQLIIAKQRNGPPGEVDLVFLSEYTRFESRSKDWQG